MNFEEALIKAIEEECPEERTFGRIQSSMGYLYSDMQPDENGDMRRVYTEAELFQKLLALQERYGITLTSPEFKKYIDPKDFSIRQQEAFGLACRSMPRLSRIIKGKKDKEVRCLGGAERGYIFALTTNDKNYIVKPLQSLEEFSIAPHVSRLGLGPKIYDISEDWLFEEFMYGTPLTTLSDASFVGHVLGMFFGRLHKEGIECDHWRFPYEMRWEEKRRKLRMIDFGTARYGNNFSRDYEDIKRFLDGFKESKLAGENFVRAYNSVSNLDLPKI